jgi:hypothetical protein
MECHNARHYAAHHYAKYFYAECPGSISPTFFEQFLRQIPFAKKLQNQIVST